ncbi:MAG: hypothetical protein OSB45_09545, partial [Pseudomonadales bacterium]|nr:hypothetical protein [Pseudomonadales bacterium]
MIKSVFLLGLVFWLSGCSEQQPSESVTVAVVEASDYQTQLQTSLLNAQRGDVITIPAGIFEFNRSLSLNVDGVTIRGAGMDQTILSFKGQISGAEGLLVTASDFIIEDVLKNHVMVKND